MGLVQSITRSTGIGSNLCQFLEWENEMYTWSHHQLSNLFIEA